MSSSVQPLPHSPSEAEPSAGLRTSLRNVPMLPAPANVDDLIARLDAEDVPLSSGPLAAMISDARAADLEPLSPDLYGFEESSPDNFFAPVALAANTNIEPPAPLRRSRSAGVLRLLCAGLLAGACMLASPTVPPLETAQQSRAVPMIEVPELAPTALAAPSEFDRPSIVADMPPVMDASASPAKIVEAETRPRPEDTVVSAEAGDAAPMVDETDDPVSAPETEGAVEAAVAESEAPMDGDLSSEDADGATAGFVENAPLPPSRPASRANVPFAGLWATSAKACRPEMQKRGSLVADINGERGRAGNTTCTFKTMERRGNGWAMAAVCSNGRKTWTSDVRLSMKGGRLIWTGRKGTATYVRCPSA
jgi:hypothetical protein